MSRKTSEPGSGNQETKLHEVGGVQVYGRRDDQGKLTKLDAIDQDQEKIREIAGRLQRRGFGVMRQRNPRAGKVFYTLKATWAGDGTPPEDPFEGTGSAGEHATRRPGKEMKK